MPTTRPRHLVIETDELAAALNDAATRWPGVSRAQLITRLALEGHRAVAVDREQRRAQRLDAVRRHSGLLTGLYGAGYVDRLHAEWPA